METQVHGQTKHMQAYDPWKHFLSSQVRTHISAVTHPNLSDEQLLNNNEFIQQIGAYTCFGHLFKDGKLSS